MAYLCYLLLALDLGNEIPENFTDFRRKYLIGFFLLMFHGFFFAAEDFCTGLICQIQPTDGEGDDSLDYYD